MRGIEGMKRIAALAALCAGFSGLLPAPAAAQFFGWMGYRPFEYGFQDDAPLSGGAIRGILQRQGYRLTGPLQRNGDVILADVSDGRGRQLRLIVDMYEGRVLQRFLSAEPRPPRSARSQP